MQEKKNPSTYNLMGICILIEVWLCPSEGYNAPLHGGSVKTDTWGKADVDGLLKPGADSRWCGDRNTDGT